MALLPMVLSGLLAWGAEDMALRLAELSSPSAQDRARAERWIATHVTTQDLPLVLRAAEGADAEVKRRLARALGAEDRSLAIAGSLVLAGSADAVELGEQAFGEIAARWSSQLDARPLTGYELIGALDLRARERRAELLRIDLAAPLEKTVDLLSRVASVPLGLVVDPGLVSRADRRAFPEVLSFVGTWDRLLIALAATHGAGLEAVGLDADGRARGGVFLRLTVPGEEGTRTGRETLVAFARGGSAGREALVATGWPAALSWVAKLHTEGEPGALSAGLLGAARGRWPPQWNRKEVVSDLLERMAAAIENGEPAQAERLSRALAEAPCNLGDGTQVDRLLGERWDAAGERERQLLLVVLEGLGCAGSDGDWEQRLRDLLAASAPTPAPLVRQGLRAWARVCAPVGVREPALGDAAGLLVGETVWGAGDYRELAELLGQAGVEPPSSLEDPAGLAALGLAQERVHARIALWIWLADAGRLQAAVDLLLAAPRPPETWAEALEGCMRRGEGATVVAVLEQARRGGATEPQRRDLEWIALSLGLLEGERRGVLLAEALRAEVPEVGLLGALAGLPDEEGEAARSALLSALQKVLAQGAGLEQAAVVTDAVELALGGLLRAGEDGSARALRSAAWAVVQRTRAPGARERLALAGWPPFPPALAARDLTLLDRP